MMLPQSICTPGEKMAEGLQDLGSAFSLCPIGCCCGIGGIWEGQGVYREGLYHNLQKQIQFFSLYLIFFET